MTGEFFPGNIIPESRISQFARAGQKYFRVPAGSPLPNFNYSGLTGTKRRGDQGTVRLDHNLGDRIRFDGFVTMSDREDVTPALNEYNGTTSVQLEVKDLQIAG